MTRRPAKWNFPPPLPESLSRVSLAERVLYARGCREAADVHRFLNPRVEHMLDPMGLRDMDRAVERLVRAIRDKEPILLYGDYDVDGTVSVVVLKTTLTLAGACVDFHIPHRLVEGYGMRPEVIDAAAERGVKLVVSVDTGIRARAVVEHAREAGIDVIVTDHHLPEAELPPAAAVVNPNRPDCTYPEKNLCGAGVTLKLVQATMRALGWPEERVAKLLDSFLKLVAIATVADVVPLTGENRVIVRRGLDGLTDVRNPGLRALLKVAGFAPGERPAAGQVAFRIAPRINAAGRMDDARNVIELFLTTDPQRAADIAGKLQDLNQDRRDTESEILRSIDEECERTPVTDFDCALVFSNPDWHKGVVGIVASRVVERYHRPVFVLCEDAATGLAVGSGRSVRSFHLLEALESMHELFVKFGGHRQAAGLTIRNEAIPEFRRRLSEYASRILRPEDFCATCEIDAVMTLAELNESAVRDVERLAPFGFGNPAPLFALMDVEVQAANLRGEKMVNIAIRQNGGRTLILTGWDWRERLDELRPGTRVNATVALEDRGRNGEWRAVLKDAQPVAAAAGLQSP
ncbi:MAG: single-stranded-DNA-specific exonuclease RecJ [Bryobacteraceae bacterium]|nr:single-stranded-DNA-specific exonuclease RecJ [Bryobacteraceae bacterium]